jgi:alpha-mannosidase
MGYTSLEERIAARLGHLGSSSRVASGGYPGAGATSPVARYPEDYTGLRAGFVKPAGIAWYASHHHTADGLNEPYQYSYLFAYALETPVNARTLTLPNNDKIRVLAISMAEENPQLSPAQPLYDPLNHTEPPQSSEQATR